MSVQMPQAEERLLRAALRVVAHEYEPDSAHADAQVGYDKEQLAWAALHLVRAVNDSDDKPAGWDAA